MVICKFFQQGNCRYGQNCRFEHIYGSKYSYHAPVHTQAVPQSAPSSITDETLVNQVQMDIQAALKGGQWLMSCYAPFKEKRVIPGLSDLSSEEMRLFIYEAKANNNTEAAITYINKQMVEARQKYEQLLQPTVSMIKMLRSLYNGETVQSPFTQNQGFGATNTATSIFRSAVQNTGFSQSTSPTPSIFGQSQNNNVFGNQQQNTSVFGSQSDPAKSIFASANQNVFPVAQTPNVFQNQNQDAAKSIFSQATQNVFGAAQPASQAPVNIFSTPQNPFGSTSDVFKQNTVSNIFPVQSQSGGLFHISDKPTSNVFGTVKSNTNQSVHFSDDGVYSKIDDLTPDDIEAYKSPAFKLGFIPELPPSADLCR